MTQLYVDQISPTNPSAPVNFVGTNKPTYLGNPLVSGFSGSFTTAAQAYIDVLNVSITSGSKIFVFPTNAAAATLMRGTKALIPQSRASGQIRMVTADGTNMAGGETFDFVIAN